MLDLPDTNTLAGQREASAILARLVGWQQSERFNWAWSFPNGDYVGSFEWSLGLPMNLYHERNTGLAWRVLNWATGMMEQKKNQAMSSNDMDSWGYWHNGQLEMWTIMALAQKQQPAEAQRAWLDKAVEIAIGAGMVNDD